MNDYVLVVPYLPSSPNRTRGRRWKIASEAREAKRQVWAAVMALPSDQRPRSQGRPALVNIRVRTRRGPLPDADNSLARCKPLIDGLTQQGVLVDDSPEWAQFLIGVERGDPSVEFHIRYSCITP